MSVITQTLRVRGDSSARWRSWTVTAAVVATLGTALAAGRLSAPDATAVGAARPPVEVRLAQDRPWIRPGRDRGIVKVQSTVDAINDVGFRPGSDRGTVKLG
jgi:hypothetical protein